MDGVCQKAAGSYRCGLFIFISVLSEIDSGRRLLQITVTKTLVSKGRILRKKNVYFLSLQESIRSERFWHLGKVPNDWKIANMPGKDGDVGNRGRADWKGNLERNAKPWDRGSPGN